MVNTSQIAAVLLVVVFCLWALLSAWIHYNSWLIWLSWRLQKSGPTRPAEQEQLPHVTVQLPVFNEENVVARLVESVGNLDWPAELLEVQLLDDSTDRTPDIAAPVIAQLRARGINARHIRRTDRSGYKAGALASALPEATGEFILILDADFVPARNLLHQFVPWFSDPKVAMVQGQWGRLAPPASLVERSASYWIERHFEVEQLARSRSGQFFHFNGSGGMWRKSAIEDAGGWTADTLAEDLDLSFRAWQRGWKFIFDFDAIVPAEIPPTVAALRVQQRRWSRGAFQVARKAIPKLAASRLRDRLTISLQLTGYSFPILMLALALTAGPVAWARAYHPVFGLIAGDLPMIGFIIGIIVQFFSRLARSGLRDAWTEIEAAAVGIGMAPLVLKAGYSGLRTSGGVFERTPKSTRATGRVESLVIIEALLGLTCVASAAWALALGAPWIAVLPLMAGTGLFIFAWRTVRP